MAIMNFGGVDENVVTRAEFPLEKAREVLKDDVIAVIGYGVQGPGQSLNLRDNGFNVTDNSALGLPRAEIRMACSKGTYVRAFARDLGETLGSGAHLDSLQRSRSGEFCVKNALTVEQVIEKLA